MLCSDCNKKPAILFIDKVENGKTSSKGLCFDCAKKRGIDPTETLKRQTDMLMQNGNMENMAKQFEGMFQNLTQNLNPEDIKKIEKAIDKQMNPEEYDDEEDVDENSQDPNSPQIFGTAIPLGSIFSNMFGGSSNPNEDQNEGKNVKVDTKNKPKTKKKKYLDTYGTNLTDKAKNNQLDTVIGRNKEIQRVIQILNRRSKNNPCLIGEPGVGKTAIAQGLAIKIAEKNVPAKLLDKEVYLLDMTAVIAGTQFRGQFEARMKGIID